MLTVRLLNFLGWESSDDLENWRFDNTNWFATCTRASRVREWTQESLSRHRATGISLLF